MPNASFATGTIATGSPSRAISYVGRFAPSPTGPLHFGSLLAAVASYLAARARQGLWLLRIENIDPPREQPGASDAILAALDAYGFEWDGTVSYQSTSREQHLEAVETLSRSGLAYHCGCSRRDLAEEPGGPLGSIYPGTCRSGFSGDEFAVRVRTDDNPIVFADGLQGKQSHRLESQSGDFVILRRDGLVAYQLAVVVDDYLQGITEIVRGVDLMPSTPRQIWLQQLLGYPTPDYQHIPVAVNTDGQKLSKNTGAAGLPLDSAQAVLVLAFRTLGLNPPADLVAATIADIWRWALDNWDIRTMAGRSELPAPDLTMAAAKNGLR